VATRLSTIFSDFAVRITRLVVTSFALVSLVLITSGEFAARHASSARATSQGEGASIIGVIQDDRGEPVSDVKVTASSLTTTVSVLTRADGRFEFRGLKPGQYQIVAQASRFRKEKITVIVARPDDVANPPPIKLTPSSLHVTVLDSSSQPLSGVTLTVHLKEHAQGEPQTERRTTDDSGDAYFGRLAPGSYQLTATLRGYDEYRNDVFISSGITTEFPVQLAVAPVIPINEKALTRYGPPALPSKNILSLFQDSEGWMWFGTDKGIARFNGTEFKSSTGSTFDRLSGLEVRSMVEDSIGTIWVATPQSVLQISKRGVQSGETTVVSDPRRLLADSRHNIWIAGGGGLARVNPGEVHVVSEEDCSAIAEDAAGRIWVATRQGLNAVDHDRLVPVEVSLAAGITATREVVLSRITQIFVDHGGSIWLATAQGAFHLDNPQPGSGQGILRATGIEKNWAQLSSGVRDVIEDSHGRLWFALEAGGVLLFDRDRGESEQVGFLDKDRIASMTTSRDGQMWFGGDAGAVQSDLYSFVSFTASRGLPDNEINAISQMPAGLAGGVGRVWFFSSTGVSRMEGDRFQPVEGFRSNINVQDVALDSEGNAWFATEQGALRLSGRTLTQFNEGSGLASNDVRCVQAIANGTAIAFGTSRGASIFKSAEMQSLKPLAGYDVRHVFEDQDGALWLATNRGAVRFDLARGEAEIIDTERGLADNDARWIIRFDDRLLIATRGGIQSYAAGSTRPVLSVFDGDSTSTMFVDRDGYLWSGTDQGQVKKFTAVGGQVISTVYSGESNALSGSQVNSISQDEEGHIWIATNRGAVRHIPLRVVPQAQVSLEVDGHPYERTESTAAEVSYGRHRFTFKFAAVSLNGPARYLYRVNPDGGSAPWKVLAGQQSAEGEISLLDLDDGLHSFELIALNRDLYGAATPAATVLLRVGLPFWKRWWFYAASFVVLGLAAGFFLVNRRLRDREYVLPRELRTFLAIEPNPYIVGNPIRTEAMFFGRQDDFRYVRTKLEGVSQGVVIVFCGERRVGKSSILYQVLNGRLGDRFIPVFIDLQEMVVSSDSEFFTRISRLISEAVARACERAAEPVASAVGTSLPGTARAGTAPTRAVTPVPATPEFHGRNPYTVFLDFLDNVLNCIGDRTLLMLLDEYELLEGKVDEGKLSPEFFTFLAGLMDNRERLGLIFTGSRRLEERDKKYWRELLRRSLFRKVGFLSSNDTVRLITDPVSGRVVYARGVVDEICRLTAGQPFYTQVICQNIVDFINEHKQNWVTLADLKRVIGEVVDNPLPQMIYAWDALSDDEKLVLSLLGEVLVDGMTYAGAYDLRESVKQNDYPVNLSENTIRLTLEELFRRELVEKDASDGFRFKIDLLRLWIHRSHSIWQVVKEVRTR
jgi:ligand-binding sensor domain-containing protein/AAA+ ATPase superfamily predicted ATPase